MDNKRKAKRKRNPEKEKDQRKRLRKNNTHLFGEIEAQMLEHGLVSDKTITQTRILAYVNAWISTILVDKEKSKIFRKWIAGVPPSENRTQLSFEDANGRTTVKKDDCMAYARETDEGRLGGFSSPPQTIPSLDDPIENFLEALGPVPFAYPHEDNVPSRMQTSSRESTPYDDVGACGPSIQYHYARHGKNVPGAELSIDVDALPSSQYAYRPSCVFYKGTLQRAQIGVIHHLDSKVTCMIPDMPPVSSNGEMCQLKIVFENMDGGPNEESNEVDFQYHSGFEPVLVSEALHVPDFDTFQYPPHQVVPQSSSFSPMAPFFNDVGRWDASAMDTQLLKDVVAEAGTECLLAEDAAGSTLLQALARDGNVAALRFVAGCLAGSGRSSALDVKNELSLTALHMAAERGSFKAVYFLLSAGARLYSTPAHPRDLAARHGHLRSTVLLHLVEGGWVPKAAVHLMRWKMMLDNWDISEREYTRRKTLLWETEGAQRVLEWPSEKDEEPARREIQPKVILPVPTKRRAAKGSAPASPSSIPKSTTSTKMQTLPVRWGSFTREMALGNMSVQQLFQQLTSEFETEGSAQQITFHREEGQRDSVVFSTSKTSDITALLDGVSHVSIE